MRSPQAYYAEVRNKWLAHLRGLAPEQHSSEKNSQRWRDVGDALFDLTGPGIESQISRTDSDVLSKLIITNELTGQLRMRYDAK